MDLIDLRYSEVDNPDLDCSGKEKWSMMQKASASFAQLIAYSSNRCHADGFSRVLIPYAVEKHWNMIVVDVGEKVALLFEGGARQGRAIRRRYIFVDPIVHIVRVSRDPW